jgi:hypothetical protein
MCRGFGRTQRQILALIKARPDEAWPVDDLCRAVYQTDLKPTRAQINSLTRALKMPLPGWWTFGKIWPDCRWFLYDASRRNKVSVLLAVTDLRDAFTEIKPTEPMRAFEVERDGEGRIVRVVGERAAE